MRWWICLLVSAGCNGSGAHVPALDLGSAGDLSAPRITAGPTAGTVQLAGSDITLSGAGSARIGAISLTHGSGTVEIDGQALPASVYQRQLFGNYLLYQTLAIESDRLWVLWFYCSTTDHSLASLYYEATDGTVVTPEGATGTCMDAGATSTVSVDFPAIDLPLPPLVHGFTISGAQVSLEGDGAPGTVTLGAKPLEVLVFNTVDCTQSCAQVGWTELHALLWDRDQARVCFAIFYLRADDTTHVQIAWALTLPSLTDPAGNALLPATWTVP